MAYNGFPVNYQPAQMYYPQQQNYPNVMPQQTQQMPQQTTQQTQQNSNLIWVQGEAGAKSYLVAPNTTVQLWDSESQTIYLKSADASGMPSMKILDYQIREDQSHSQVLQPQNNNNVSYVTKEELDVFKRDLNDVRNELDKLMRSKSKSKAKDGEE